jgi:hypothetical protein
MSNDHTEEPVKPETTETPVSVAENAVSENQQTTETQADESETHDELVPQEDLSGLSQADLLQRMETAVAHEDTEAQRHVIRQLKEVFRAHANEELEAKRRAHEATKEDENDLFEPAPNAESDRFEELLRGWNQKRSEQRRKTEVDQKKNLGIKYALIEELKTLAESSESMQKAFDKFHDIQERWRKVGPVPQANVNELRQNWNHHNARFFDVVKIGRELRELDHKKNLELKTELCEKAETLADEPSIKKALDRLHQLHEQWKEIGPSSKDTNEAIWDRFKLASDKVHERKHIWLEDQRESQKENLTQKLTLCDQMENFANQTYDSHKGWQDANAQAETMFEAWKKIGFVPKEDDGKTWKRFKDARQNFFRNREAFYAKQRDESRTNYNDKLKICEQAEALSTSTDWKNTANQLKRLQDDWKKTGPIPRKQADKLWLRFKAAADTYFNNRNAFYAEADAALKSRAEARTTFIAALETVELTDDLKANLEKVRSLQEEWNGMGEMPRNDREKLERAFQTAMNKLMDRVKEKSGADSGQLEKLRYEQLANSAQGRDQLRDERTRLQEKIKKLQAEVNTLETNLGFFGKSKGASGLVAEYEQKLTAGKAEIEQLKAKLKRIPRPE